MPSPISHDCPAPTESARSGPTPWRDCVEALRSAAIPIWLLLCVVGTWLWGGYATLGLVFLSWKAAAKYG